MVKGERARVVKHTCKDVNEQPNRHLTASIFAALHEHADLNATAFAIIVSDGHENTFTHASENLGPQTDRIFSTTAKTVLKDAHETSNAQRDCGPENHDLWPCVDIGAVSSTSSALKVKRRPLVRSLASKKSCTSSANPASNSSSSARNDVIDDYDETEQEGLKQVSSIMESFMIGESEKVELFLENQLKRVQQLAVKKIAKAWIKGICPKKQAHFPYTNAEQRHIEIPGWWPLEKCRFVEPDHVGRSERTALCLHLLRLRPSVEQLQDWNRNTSAPNDTHRVSWTDFLMELAPISILEDISETSPEKARLRAAVLEEMYHVAREEEDHLVHDGLDGTSRHHPWIHQESKSKSSKRAHPSSNTAGAQQLRPPSSTATSNMLLSQPKRRRLGDIERMAVCRASQANFASRVVDFTATDTANIDGNDFTIRASDRSPRQAAAYGGQVATFDSVRQASWQDSNGYGSRTQNQKLGIDSGASLQQCALSRFSHGSIDHQSADARSLSTASWPDVGSLSTSFLSHTSQTSAFDPYRAWTASSNFSGEMDYVFSAFPTAQNCVPGHDLYQVQQATPVAQPGFVTTLTSPIRAAAELMPSPSAPIHMPASTVTDFFFITDTAANSMPAPQTYMLPPQPKTTGAWCQPRYECSEYYDPSFHYNSIGSRDHHHQQE